MKISSRQGQFELMSVSPCARPGGIKGIYFFIFFNMEVYCVFALVLPHGGDSNVHTQHAIFITKKLNHPRLF